MLPAGTAERNGQVRAPLAHAAGDDEAEHVLDAAQHGLGVGLGEATLSPSVHSFLADAFPRARLARAMGIYTVGISLGGGLALLCRLLLGAIAAVNAADAPRALVNARIWTGDPETPWAEAMAWEGERIVAIALASLADRRAAARRGSATDAMIAMIATTIMSSISVKPARS